MNIFPAPLSQLTGWPSLLLEVFALLVGGWYILKRGKSQYEEAARKAQGNAMEAMKEESESLRRRVEDVEKENIRLNTLVENIYNALRAKKIMISVLGDTVDIRMEKET